MDCEEILSQGWPRPAFGVRELFFKIFAKFSKKNLRTCVIEVGGTQRMEGRAFSKWVGRSEWQDARYRSGQFRNVRGGGRRRFAAAAAAPD